MSNRAKDTTIPQLLELKLTKRYHKKKKSVVDGVHTQRGCAVKILRGAKHEIATLRLLAAPHFQEQRELLVPLLGAHRGPESPQLLLPELEGVLHFGLRRYEAPIHLRNGNDD